MNERKIKRLSDRAVMPFIVLMLLISYVMGLTVHYARYAAHGGETAWTYLIIKGILLSVLCLAVYRLAGKYGIALLEKYRQPIFCIGTGVLLLFAMFEYRLGRVNTPVLSKVTAYAYEALPILRVITLCALVMCLQTLLTEPFKAKNIALLVVGLVFGAIVNDIVKLILLIVLADTLIRRFKRKNEKINASCIIVCLLSAGLFAYLVYAGIIGCRYLMNEWYLTDYMTQVSHGVWRQAKLFGTMENFQAAGGSVSYFGLLWAVAFLGIIPAVMIVLILAVLTAFVLKRNAHAHRLSALSRLVIIYLAVRTVIALLTNCGVFFHSFMTPMPMLSDTAAGMLSVYWLLGIFGKTEKESR